MMQSGNVSVSLTLDPAVHPCAAISACAIHRRKMAMRSRQRGPTILLMLAALATETAGHRPHLAVSSHRVPVFLRLHRSAEGNVDVQVLGPPVLRR